MTEHVILDTTAILEDEEVDAIIQEWTDEPITDNMRWDYRADLRNDEWDDLMCECKHVSGEFLVIADLGLWYGRRRGWKFCSTLSDAIRACVDGMDDIRIVEDGRGKVVLYGYHHDGTNVYEIRKVTGEIASTTSEKSARKHSRNAHLMHEFGWI